MRDVIMKRNSVSHDGQQFQQYQKNPPLTSKSLTKMKITTHNVGNPGTGSGRAKPFLC